MRGVSVSNFGSKSFSLVHPKNFPFSVKNTRPVSGWKPVPTTSPLFTRGQNGRVCRVCVLLLLLLLVVVVVVVLPGFGVRVNNGPTKTLPSPTRSEMWDAIFGSYDEDVEVLVGGSKVSPFVHQPIENELPKYGYIDTMVAS